MKIKKGDNVIVIAGKDKGKTSKVLKVLPKESKVLVEGVNMLKKHKKARREGEKGQVIEMAMPVHISNVSLVIDNKPVRVGYKVVAEKKVRFNKKTNKSI